VRKIELKTTVTEYDSLDELQQEDRQLIEKADEASKNAYAPYSNFFVGAALLLEDGEIVTGNNQENVASPSGLCAERVAIFNAGARYANVVVKKIAIFAMSPKFEVDYPVSPCGACRQVMSEYEMKQEEPIVVFMKGESGPIKSVESIKDLLPLLFYEKELQKA
jgi:cytidine deaminase